jgi:hypothetical protein
VDGTNEMLWNDSKERGVSMGKIEGTDCENGRTVDNENEERDTDGKGR